MKHSLAWIAAECATVLLSLSCASLALAALLNLLEISSVFSNWFESAYVPALLAVLCFGLRLVAKAVAGHYLDLHDEDQDEVLASE